MARSPCLSSTHSVYRGTSFVAKKQLEISQPCGPNFRLLSKGGWGASNSPSPLKSALIELEKFQRQFWKTLKKYLKTLLTPVKMAVKIKRFAEIKARDQIATI